MRDYSYDELEEMQEKALKRVQNMQARSRAYVEGNADAENMPSAAMPTQMHYTPPKAPKPRLETPPAKAKGKSGMISMPLNLPEEKEEIYPSFKSYFAPHNTAEKKKIETGAKADLFDKILKEPDEALLFCLLLLLRADKVSESLLLALLYILL